MEFIYFIKWVISIAKIRSYRAYGYPFVSIILQILSAYTHAHLTMQP